MDIIEPKMQQLGRAAVAAQGGSIEGRWRWWYSSIADWMIENPQGKLSDCAVALNKHVNTIVMIVNTDMFKEYFARRRDEWRKDHDFALAAKMTRVANASLDVILDKLQKKGDQIPMSLATSTAFGALDRLGYAPKTAPSVVVQNNVDNSKNINVIAPVSVGELAEAREAMRKAQEHRAIVAREREADIVDAVALEPPVTPPPLPRLEVRPAFEDDDGPLNISAQ